MADSLVFNKTTEKAKYNSTLKKWLGITLMGLSLLCIVLCIFPRFLNLGLFLYRIFGYSGFVIYIATFLLGFASYKNLSFTAGVKYAVYIFMSYLSVLCLLHLIFSTEVLSSYYITFSHMGGYIADSYNLSHGITVGGASLSILVFVIRAISGIAGSYIVYIITAAIFIGLSIDYVIYNRAIERRKRLYSQKSKQELEDKLVNDAKIINNDYDNMPQYSFSPIREEREDKEQVNKTTQAYERNDYEQARDFSYQQDNNYNDFSNFGFPQSQPQTQNFDSNPKEDYLNVNQEREMARRKLFGDFDDNSSQENQKPQEKKSARELLYGDEPKLPDYFYNSNRKAEQDTRNFVNNYPRVPQNDTYRGYSEPTPTRTPNLDNNILNNNSVRTSWNSFEPEVTNDNFSPNARAGVMKEYEETQSSRNTSASDLFGFNNSRNQENINFFSATGGNNNDNDDDINFTPKRDRASSIPVSPTQPTFKVPEIKPEIKPERKVTKQTNIYDDAPKKYFAPPLSLLKTYKDDARDHSAEHQKKTAILNQVLESFKIPAQVSNVVRGPKFTRYEISLQIGVSVTKILQIEKNIEMALETDSGIRIEAPIPGKNAVGIEVKNDVATTVGLKELLESPEYANSKHALPVVIGKNITGNIVVSSMDKMLHALVAGSTGSGKSVFVHALILSLLYKCSPDELKILIVDPKQVDFVKYNGLPHLVAPEAFFSYEQAVNALTWSVKEMERRYGFLKQEGYSNIKDYNNSPRVKSGEVKRIPYIVIIIDEFSNLMSEDKNSTLELMIKKVTEKARAAGIHMVVATQRPSVDVITGVIKNNLPTRVALTLSSGVDSKTIINEVGAEKLLGYGDMLFAPQDSNKKIRLQGAFVSDDEIKDIVQYIKSHNISSYDESIAEEINKKREEPSETETMSSSSNNNDNSGSKMDELMPRCLELVIQRGKATTTMLQTKLSIGYARAARIIDQMEEMGFISSSIDGKPREVYITQAQFDEQFGSKDE